MLFLAQKYLWGVVVGHRIGESRERGRLGVGKRGVRVEAKVSDRVDLEDRIDGIIPRNRDFRCGVMERRGGVPVFLGRALWPDPVGFGLTRSQGKRRVGHKRSGRCPTNCREG